MPVVILGAVVTFTAGDVATWLGIVGAVVTIGGMIIKQSDRLLRIEIDMKYLREYVHTEIAKLPRRKDDAGI